MLFGWAGVNLGFLRRVLPFAGGIPSHDTLNENINALDADLFTAYTPLARPG